MTTASRSALSARGANPNAGLTCNDAGLDIIREFEGLRLTAYLCPAGKWTIGYGHTLTAREGQTITKDEAERLLREDVGRCEAAIRRHVKVPLSANQFSALCSWVFNLGEGNLMQSTLLQRINEGGYARVPEELMRWVFVRRQKFKGLTRRREAEVKLWSTP